MFDPMTYMQLKSDMVIRSKGGTWRLVLLPLLTSLPLFVSPFLIAQHDCVIADYFVTAYYMSRTRPLAYISYPVFFQLPASQEER